MSWFNVFPILAILAGIHPPRSLLAKTRTETGELPRFSGIPKRNRLSLRNKASRESACKPVVTEIQLPKESHVFEAPGDHTAKAIGVEVEEGEMREKAELRDEMTRNVCMVEVDTRHHFHRSLGLGLGGGQRGAVYSGVPETLVLEVESLGRIYNVVISIVAGTDLEAQEQRHVHEYEEEARRAALPHLHSSR
nr:hypothetical protein LSAT_8X69640 [Ipomoea batatas]